MANGLSVSYQFATPADVINAMMGGEDDEREEWDVSDDETFEAWVRAGGSRTLLEFATGVAS